MSTVWVFPGQGSQQRGMGIEVIDRYPELARRAGEIIGRSVRELCLAADDDNTLHRTQFAQPAMFVVSALSFRAAIDDGAPLPEYLAGHSLGEYTALLAAGRLDFDTGVRLVQRRGSIMAGVTGGAMLAVLGMTAERVLEVLESRGYPDVDLANRNGPAQNVLSGPEESVRALSTVLREEGAARCVLLNVAVAAHSRYLRQAADEFGIDLRATGFGPASRPVISNVTARPYGDADVAAMLQQHMSHPVRWLDTMRYLRAQGVTDLREIGPGRVLTKFWDATTGEAVQPPPTAPDPTPRTARELVLLSARGDEQLRRAASRMREHLLDPATSPHRLADIAYTTQTARVAVSHRLLLQVDDFPGAVAGLTAYLAGQALPGVHISVTDPAMPAAAGESGPATVAAAATDWLAGAQIPWKQYWDEPATVVRMPAYPFSDGVEGAAPHAGEPAGAVLTGSRADRQGRLERYLLHLYAELAELPVADLHPRVPLENYGLTSKLINLLNSRMRQDLGNESHTLFFTHPDLAGIAADLAEHTDTPAADSPAATPPPALLPAVPAPAPASRRSASTTDRDADHGDDRSIAIIGMAGRYPQAIDVGQFWDNLLAGRDSVTALPEERRRPGWPVELMWGGFIDGVDRFDPALFNITPRDARLMDPQERQYLQVAWEALEDAGYSRTRLREQHGSRVGVYAGSMYNEYPFFGVEQSMSGTPSDSGSAIGGIANRVSYFFDLHGPSMTVDTMCSSAISALHLAVRSLRAGDCELAMAGAVNLSLHPNKFIQQRRMKLTASGLRSRSFGEGGDGFVPSEGVGLVVLKPLAAALADGDRIRAVLRGSAVVHAGRTNGYIVPSPVAQGDLVRRALADADVDPATIGYVEAHGAGTALGDPVEIDGLMRGFTGARRAPGTVPIGAVKSNIGHVEAAAGIAGLMKVVLQLEHRTLVPSLHAERLNPNIAWTDVPFAVQREVAPWPQPDGEHIPRRAALNSFGAGGTICHVIVEEAPPMPQRPAPVQQRLLVLSAFDEVRLREVVRRLADFLAGSVAVPGDHQALLRELARIASGPPPAGPDGAPLSVRDLAAQLLAGTPANGPTRPALGDIAWTLQVGREHLRERFAVVTDDPVELLAVLRRFLAGDVDDAMRGRTPSTAEPSRTDPAVTGSRSQRELARHWIAGGFVDWAELYADDRRGGMQPRVVALPSYPFAGERYWLEPAPGAGPAEVAPAESPLYTKTWQPAVLAERTHDDPAGVVVCLADGSCAALAATLGATFGTARVIVVRPGDDLSTAVSHADQSGSPVIAGWIDLRDLESTDAAGGDWAGRLAALQQVLAGQAGRPLRILHLARGLVDLPGAPAGIAGARMAAFVRLLGAEHPAATAVTVDVGDASNEEIVRQIRAEWAEPKNLGEICYRKSVRYEPRLRRVSAPDNPLPIDPGSTYVVTGGSRGLGARVARFLVAQGATSIALMSAQEIPDRADWPRAGPSTPGAEAIRTVQDLEAAGARVELYTGSLSDRTLVGAFLERVRSSGRIGGVVHCAGTVSRGAHAFTRRSAAAIGAMLEPKTTGLQVLDELCRPDPLAFFLTFSSVCASVPALAKGVVDYAAANGFMDYYVGYRRRLGATALRSVDWPMWQESGSGTGKPNVCAPVGMAALGDDEALSILRRALGQRGGQVLLPCPPLDGPVDVDALLRMTPVPDRISPPPVPAPALAVAAATGAVPSWLRSIFAETLGAQEDALDDTSDFGELGVESIMLGELLERIEHAVGRRLEPSMLLDYATLRRLADHLGPPGAAGPTAPAVVVAAPEPATIPAAPLPSPAAQPAESAETDERIAVIGMACRFPGAPDVSAFWSNLVAGRCSVTEVPASRWNLDELYRPEPEEGMSMSRWGGFIEGIEDFDAGYFGLSEDEGRVLDPAIRLILHSAATGLADAGYLQAELRGRDVGVFVGGRTSRYSQRAGWHRGILQSDQNFIAAHVAHFMDWRGPNLVVDSACSSALVGVALAMQSLRSGDCSVAVAGGVEVLLDEQPYLEFSASRAISPTGRCRAFDERADGFVPGEGCAVVVLKPLAAALADGDRIHAVIESIAVNNDGHTMGLTTPNPSAQATVVRRALRRAHREAREIGMVEAHGTGTAIGDPIELRALTDVFRESTDEVGYCAVGSVKSNVGHLLAASGMAGLLKAVLSVREAVLPATLFCETPNPRFDFAGSPFVPHPTTRDWPLERPRVAGVSSFGLGGTNAHLIVAALDAGRHGARSAPGRTALPAPSLRPRRSWLDRPDRDAAWVAPAGPPLVSSILELSFR